MTDLQESFLFDRLINNNSSKKVGCHLYYEITEKNLDIDKLEESWNILVKKHQILRVIMRKNRTQELLSDFIKIQFDKYDFSQYQLNSEIVEEHLKYLRENMAYTVYDVNEWPLFDIRVTHLTNEMSIIHFSIDEWIVDISSIMLLMQEWYYYYKDIKVEHRNGIEFSDYVYYLKKQEESDVYKEKLKNIMNDVREIFGPKLPICSEKKELTIPFSREKFNLTLSKKESRCIKNKSKRLNVSETSLILTAFITVLERFSSNSEFDIVLTLFNRLPIHPDIQQVVGPFVSTTFFNWRNIDNKNKDTNSKNMLVQEKLWQSLENGDISSIKLIRELEKTKSNKKIDFPGISFTSLLGNKIQHENHNSFFKHVTYSISQTPHVFLDCQVFEKDEEIHVFWDTAPEYLKKGLVETMFESFKEELFYDSQNNWEPNNIQKSYAINKARKKEDYYSYHELLIDDIDCQRLFIAWNKLNYIYPALRMYMDSNFSIKCADHSKDKDFNFKIDNISKEMDEKKINEALLDTRQNLLKNNLSLFDNYQHIFHVTLLKERKAVVQIKLNAIFIDGKSVQILLSSLQTLYSKKELPQQKDNYFNYLEFVKKAKVKYDHDYWNKLIGKLTNGPVFERAAISKNGYEELNFVIDDWKVKKDQIEYKGFDANIFLLNSYIESIKKINSRDDFMLTYIDWNREQNFQRSVGEFTKLIWLKSNNLEFPKNIEKYLLDVNEGILNSNSDQGFKETSEAISENHFEFSTVYSSIINEDNLKTFPLLTSKIVTPSVGLDLNSYEKENKLYCKLSFSSDKIEKNTVELIGQNIRNELNKNKEQLNTLGTNKNLIERFSYIVADNPDKIAINLGLKTITYRELDKKSSILAGQLIEKGVEGSVGICLDRSINLIISIIAVLKSGCTYVPLDYQNPKDRMELIVSDSKPQLIITESQFQNLFENFEREIIKISEMSLDNTNNGVNDITACSNPNETAYIIYTSGSTGKPKGVQITHKNILHLFKNTENKFNISSDDVWTLFHSYGFDFSIWEIFGAILYGGTLEIIPKKVTKNPKRFVELINQKRVTFLNLTPTAFFQICPILIKGGEKSFLKTIIFGGEKLNFTKLKQYYEYFANRNISLYNMYGITEGTVHVTCKKIEERDLNSDISNIGFPIRGMKIQLLDEDMREVPANHEGELYLSGDGVCKGYTQEKENEGRFFKNPYDSKEIIYKTGDLGKKLINGEYEYLGRVDKQVQIRGYRIETDEIEKQILNYPNVIDTVINIEEDLQSNKLIVAYLITKHSLKIDELTDYLDNKLPSYMVPNKFELIDGFPMTSNNKIDFDKLSKKRNSKYNETFRMKNNSNVNKLKHVIKKLLKLEEVPDLSDDLFDLGLTSITLLELVEILNETFSSKITIDSVLENSSIYDLFKLVGTKIQNKNEENNDEGINLLFSIIAKVLNLKVLPNKTDDIFDLGITSISILELAEQINNHFDVSISIEELLEVTQIFEVYNLIKTKSQKNDLNYKEEITKEKLSIETFTELISHLRSEKIDGTDRYLYPSTGGKYAVQTYIIIKDSQVESLSQGCYFYNPLKNSLNLINTEISNDYFDKEIDNKLHEEASFYVFFVTQLSALRPLYKENSEDFSSIDSGYMTQLLYNGSKNTNISFGIVKNLTKESLQELLKLEGNHYVNNGLYFVAGKKKILPTIKGNKYDHDIDKIRKKIKKIKSSKTFNILSSDEHAKLNREKLNIRKNDISKEIKLKNIDFDTEHYERRASQRKFSNIPIGKSIFKNYLAQLINNDARKASITKVGLIDIFVYIKEDHIEDMSEGLYKLDQESGQLTTVSLEKIRDIEKCHFPTNRRIAKQAGFFLFFVENNDNENFSSLNIECGVQGQVLMDTQKEFNLGLVPIGGLNFEMIRESFPIKTNNVCLHSFMGGARYFNEKHKNRSDKEYFLSTGQKSLYYEYLSNPEGSEYNTVVGLKLNEKINEKKMNEALNLLFHRFPILKTSFRIKNGEPLQKVFDNNKPTLDIRHLETNNLSDVKAACIEERKKPFNLEKNVMRSIIIRDLEETEVFLMVIHHIVTDYFSSGIISTCLVELYFQLLNEETAGKITEEMDYFDYIEDEKEYEKSEEFLEDQKYWIKKLEPYYTNHDFKDEPVARIAGESFTFNINQKTFEKVTEFAKKNKLTVNSILLTAFIILNYELFPKELNTVGLITDTRTGKNKETVGYFINPTVIAKDDLKNKSVREFLNEVQSDIFSGLEHRHYPLAFLKKDLKVPYPLFNKTFQFIDRTEKDDNPLIKEIDIPQQEGQFELELELMVSSDGSLNGKFNYNKFRYNKSKIKQCVKDYENKLQNVVDNELVEVSQTALPISNNQGVNESILKGRQFNFPKELTIIDLIERAAAKHPNKVAVIGESKERKRESLSYFELNAKANSMANYLSTYTGLESPKNISIILSKKVDLIISILAVWKLGATVIPIATESPKDRIQYIINDAETSFIIYDDKEIEDLKIDHNKGINLNKAKKDKNDEVHGNIKKSFSNENNAYTLYTSGTTGKPKGISVTNTSAINTLFGYLNSFWSEKYEVQLQMASVGFDVFIGDILRSLCTGKTMVLCKKETIIDIPRLYKIIVQEKIDFAEFVPPVLRELYNFIKANKKPVINLKCVVVGSDTWTISDLRKFREIFSSDTKFYSTYGVTEAAIDSTYINCADLDMQKSGFCSIGYPMANVSLYVIDEQNNVVPKGETGELCIGGIGISKTYNNLPELTAKKFIKLRQNSNDFEKVYKTGDLVKVDKDNSLTFFGRIDSQVKLRGQRIELEEIENYLKKVNGIDDAVVLIDKNIDNEQLLAFYTEKGQKLDKKLIRTQLKKRLPDYMIPSFLNRVPNFPTNVNGKIDRRKLLEIYSKYTKEENNKKRQFNTEYKLSVTDDRNKIFSVWKNVLNIQDVSKDDDFFELGGHSFLVLQMLNSINEIFNTDISVSDFLKKSTVDNLENLIVQHNKKTNNSNNEPLNLSFSKPQEKTRNILLTGGTGYLGSHLLVDLVNEFDNVQLYCLVRGENYKNAKYKLIESMRKRKLFSQEIMNKIKIINGDLEESNFGLNEADYKVLSSKIDVVFHAGAFVNFAYPYKDLKEINVEGTRRVIDFSCTEKMKKMHFVSTTSVFDNYEKGEKIYEDSPLKKENIEKTLGYSQSKWAAEKLVEQAREQGMYIDIYRPSVISGNEFTGIWNKKDFSLILLDCFIRLRSIPDIKMKFDWVPVNRISSMIVQLSKKSCKVNNNFHLVNPKPLEVEELIEILNSFNIKIDRIPIEQWKEELLNRREEFKFFEPIMEAINYNKEDKALLYSFNNVEDIFGNKIYELSNEAKKAIKKYYEKSQAT